MVAENHQILLEQSVSVVQFSKEYSLEPLAIGYNVVLTENIELISEAAFTLPVNGETFAAHLVIGFLWGL